MNNILYYNKSMRQNMFWNEEIETMSREDLEELQLKKLQATVKRAFEKIPYYNQKYRYR